MKRPSDEEVTKIVSDYAYPYRLITYTEDAYNKAVWVYEIQSDGEQGFSNASQGEWSKSHKAYFVRLYDCRSKPYVLLKEWTRNDVETPIPYEFTGKPTLEI